MELIMVSKFQLSLDFLKKVQFLCPYCHEALQLHERSFICPNHHTFDIKKNGSVFLLKNANYKNSEFYSKTLFLQRRNFILKGFYQDVIDVIIQIILQDFSQGILLDIGCGEGTITHFLKKTLPSFQVLGMDYAKDAIDMATDYIDSQTFFFVGDVSHLCFPSKYIDVVVDFLSPFHQESVSRILKDDGYFIKVVPTKNYLKELREIYHLKEYQNEFRIPNNFVVVKKEVVEKTFSELSLEDQKYLASMTPLTRNFKENEQYVNQITISLEVIVLKKKKK